MTRYRRDLTTAKSDTILMYHPGIMERRTLRRKIVKWGLNRVFQPRVSCLDSSRRGVYLFIDALCVIVILNMETFLTKVIGLMKKKVLGWWWISEICKKIWYRIDLLSYVFPLFCPFFIHHWRLCTDTQKTFVLELAGEHTSTLKLNSVKILSIEIYNIQNIQLS